MIDTIHENTEEENSRGSTMKLACLIFAFAIILLLFNWLK